MEGEEERDRIRKRLLYNLRKNIKLKITQSSVLLSLASSMMKADYSNSDDISIIEH